MVDVTINLRDGITIEAETVNLDITPLTSRVGEVQGSPTANTLLDRLKTLATLLTATNTKLDTIAGSLATIATNTTP